MSFTKKARLSKRFSVEFKTGGPTGMMTKWDPDTPAALRLSLDADEMATYRKARDAFVADAAKRTGVDDALVVEV